MKSFIIACVATLALIISPAATAESNKVALTRENMQANGFQITLKAIDADTTEVTITHSSTPRRSYDMVAHLITKATLEIRDSSSLIARCDVSPTALTSGASYCFQSNRKNLPLATFDLTESESHGWTVQDAVKAGDEVTTYSFCLGDVIKE